METPLDPHGQPLNRRLNAARLSDRVLDELIGLSRGIVADGVVNQGEADFLAGWIERNRRIADVWPANVLYERVREMLADGILDQDEQKELLGLLRDVAGEDSVLKVDNGSFSADLPLSDPQPVLEFADMSFCFTRRFVFGSRSECQREVLSREGYVQRGPTQETDYLVVGSVGSTDWIHSSYGRKIEKAVSLRDRGFSVEVVSKPHWVSFLEL